MFTLPKIPYEPKGQEFESLAARHMKTVDSIRDSTVFVFFYAMHFLKKHTKSSKILFVLICEKDFIMATVIESKKNGKTVSFKFRAHLGRNETGKQINKYTTRLALL